MAGMNIRNKIDQLMGRGRHTVGDVSNNDQLRRQGQRQETGGRIRSTTHDAVDRAQDRAENMVRRAEDRMQRNDDERE